MSSPGRNDPCPCGSGKKFKRCCLDSAPVALGEPLAGPGELTLLVETSGGSMLRIIPSASPLSEDLSQGYAAEAATHDAASVWGLPDFVYKDHGQPGATSNRERGDGILLVGQTGVVIQVKSREAPSGDPDRERRWLDKQIKKALSQATGTVRNLQLAPARLTNLRGRQSLVDGHAYRWLSVAVIDHPEPPAGYTPRLEGCALPAVVMLRRDWEFVFDQLKSTHAAVRYFQRAAKEPVELGGEPQRYYQQALAGSQAEPQVLDPRLAAGGRLVSGRELPLAPAASDDLEAHQLVRAVLEDIASAEHTEATEAQRLQVLAELDRLPVERRAEIGRFMFDAVGEVARKARNGEIVWSYRSLRGGRGQPHLAFAACSEPHSREVEVVFSSWVRLRHHDVLQVTKDVGNLMTVGVVLTPRRGPDRQWDTTMLAVKGEERFTARELRELRKAWPSPEPD